MKTTVFFSKLFWILVMAATAGQPVRAFDSCHVADVVPDGVVDQSDLASFNRAFEEESSCRRRDLDGSGLVDAADLAIVTALLGSVCSTCRADFDEDGDVDGADRETLEAGYGADCRPDLDRNGAVDEFDSDILTVYFPVLPPLPPAAVRADLNGDGEVDASDLALLASAFGTDCSVDLNTDGAVGSDDLWVLLSSWGSCPSPPSLVFPPEDPEDTCDEGETNPIPPPPGPQLE